MAKSVYDIINDRFGVRTRADVNPTSVISVGTTALKLLSSNPMRYVLIIQNLHTTNTLFILPNVIPTATRGIALPPSGIVGFNINDDFVLPAQEWNAVANGADTDVLVIVVEGTPD